MERTFVVKPTRSTPFVNLDYNREKLVIKGRSSPVASMEFYSKVCTAIEKYLNSNENLTVFIALEYFNTSSSKCIYNLLKDLKNYHTEDNKQVTINWLYEIDDDDMKETGEDYSEILDFQFNMMSYTF